MVGASVNFTGDSGLQIRIYSHGHILVSTDLAEAGVEGVISFPSGFVTWHMVIRLDAVFQTVELSAGIANLDTRLAQVDGDAFTHSRNLLGRVGARKRKQTATQEVPLADH